MAADLATISKILEIASREILLGGHPQRLGRSEHVDSHHGGHLLAGMTLITVLSTMSITSYMPSMLIGAD